MKIPRWMPFLFVIMLISGCKTHRYLDFESEDANIAGYIVVPVLESNHTSDPVEIDGVSVHESYPITFRFFLSSGLDRKPVYYEVSGIELVTQKTKKVLRLPTESTTRVNRPTNVSHNKDTLTMHFVVYEFEKEELPFEDYTLSCRVRIEEEDGNVIEEDISFEILSSIDLGFR